jgi:hypothetical protein
LQVPTFLTVVDKQPGQPVAWARSHEEARESELDLLAGHPGRIEPECVGLDAPYEAGGAVVNWYLRNTADFPVFDVDDQDLEVISEAEYAARIARMDRGEPPVTPPT